jgi:glucose/mannose transport system substrate-binding protein
MWKLMWTGCLPAAKAASCWSGTGGLPVASFAGVNAVYEIYRQENPDVELIHAGIAGGAGVNFQGANLNKLIAGDPFDTFQLHAGLEAELYSPEEYLVPVDDVLAEAGVLDVMPEDLKALLKIRGNTYTVPLNIHRGNVMWTNTNVIEQAGVQVPTNFEEFFAVCQTLQDQGIIPLGMGIADGFELGHTLEVVLSGTVGAEKNKGLWGGTVSWTDPEVTTALENYSKVLDCTNEDRGTVGWVGGIDLVINDQAAFNIMGDWAYGEVIAKGALDKVTWNSPPGNQGQFFLVSDGFAITKDAPNPENAREFVEIITPKMLKKPLTKAKAPFAPAPTAITALVSLAAGPTSKVRPMISLLTPSSRW